MFLDRLIEWASFSLEENDEARDFLLGRGVSENQWRRHKLGYLPDIFEIEVKDDTGHNADCGNREKRYAWCDSCRYVNWSSTFEEQETGKKKRLVGERIKNCLIYPLTSYSGSLVGFQARSLIDKSYDTYTVKRRPEGFFFGVAANLELIWRKKEVFLTEGAHDLFSIERQVSSNVVAITTNSIGKYHLRFLRRFVKTVNLCLDNDEAGRTGVENFYKYYDQYFDLIRDIKIPKLNMKNGKNTKDPNDLWLHLGDAKFNDFFEKEMSCW